MPVLVKLVERVEVGSGIAVIRDVLGATECEALIARAEAMGFEPATINTRSGALLAQVFVQADELPRALPTSDGVYNKNRFREALGFGPV